MDIKSIEKELQMTLKEYRFANAMSQEDFAKGCGLSVFTVLHLETFKRRPSPRTSRKIRDFTNKEVMPLDLIKKG